MTAAQLARKRANDRLNKRASRARAQQYVYRLQQEVQELRNTLGSYRVDIHVLQELYLQNRALREELERLQELAGAREGASTVMHIGVPEMSPVYGFNHPLLNETRHQAPALNYYEYPIESPALSAQLATTASVPKAREQQGIGAASSGAEGYAENSQPM
ncbi:hypothetical protein VFPPC_06907 [Pochonia chlamydosporia 170]|uniref:BZIP domain-containing protein n=1 Tax=Pochonia chlamydosporia 170 TaxID=1380566 RepID=A0A179FBI2_METCM|nr:hypothetical protein VFPPC_06907 [Pochonia chlamydosporia 170]OAQ62469.1 hypothetical protein VFPPC_06907 [Pochonia chlamydosporia 170]